jgi:hypothetical protein
VFGRLAGHAKIRAGWLAATADQQFSWSQSGTRRDGPAVSMSSRRGVAEYYPRRAVMDGHAWMFPGCSQNHTVGSRQSRFIEPLFRSVTWGGWGSSLLQA